jgi:YD repeat-containing protein
VSGHRRDRCGLSRALVRAGRGAGLGLGYLCARSDESGEYDYQYDAFGNLTRTDFTETAGVIYTMDYAYDDGDNVLHTTYPSGRQVPAP